MVSSEIGTLNENDLHAGLKRWYARPGDETEVCIEGYVVDLVRGGLLVEIQTGDFAKMKHKLAHLTRHHRVRVVYPVAREKWIVRQTPEGRAVGRRRSPRRDGAEQLFDELVSFPRLLTQGNLSIEVAFIQEEEVRRPGGRAWRRNGWTVHERRLLSVLGQRLFETPADLAALVPPELPEPFTVPELAAAVACPGRLAGRMAYCLRRMGALAAVGKRVNAILYARATPRPKCGVTFLGVEPRDTSAR